MYFKLCHMFMSHSSSAQSKEDNKADDKGLIPGKSADCYNGAVLDRYSWSQTIRDIEVKIPVPSSVNKGRDVGVEIKSSHLKVWLKKDVSPSTGTNCQLDTCISNWICENLFWPGSGQNPAIFYIHLFVNPGR